MCRTADDEARTIDRLSRAPRRSSQGTDIERPMNILTIRNDFFESATLATGGQSPQQSSVYLLHGSHYVVQIALGVFRTHGYRRGTIKQIERAWARCCAILDLLS